jgi:hypothetical protein
VEGQIEVGAVADSSSIVILAKLSAPPFYIESISADLEVRMSTIKHRAERF